MKKLKVIFKEAREAREDPELSQAEIARRCGLDKSTVWKIENDAPVAVETFTLILTDGLSLKPTDDLYQDLMMGWVMERTGMTPALQEKVEKRLAGRFNRRAGFIAAQIAALTRKDQEELLKAAARPEVMDVVRAMNKAFES